MDTVEISGFQWDKGNREKCQKHGVSIETIETLFQRPLAVLPDEGHSQDEQRFLAIGKTDEGRYVFVVYTLHRDREARYMHKKEVDAYEKANPGL